MVRNRPKCTSLLKQHRAELGVADACRVLQHLLEHWLELAGRELMTLSTSDVAVCCSSDIRAAHSLSRRVFSIAITAWLAKF